MWYYLLPAALLLSSSTKKSKLGLAAEEDDPKLTVRPVHTAANSGYSWRTHPIRKERTFHAGLDMAIDAGTPVKAAGDGVVSVVKRDSGQKKGYGNMIVLDHGNGWTTRYAHLKKMFVKQGDTVTAGDIIGEVGSTGGSTGPHLHFEVRKDGEHKNPNDYIPRFDPTKVGGESPEETIWERAYAGHLALKSGDLAKAEGIEAWLDVEGWNSVESQDEILTTGRNLWYSLHQELVGSLGKKKKALSEKDMGFFLFLDETLWAKELELLKYYQKRARNPQEEGTT